VAIDHRFEAAGAELDRWWAAMLKGTIHYGVSEKAVDTLCHGITFETLERLKAQVRLIIENG